MFKFLACTFGYAAAPILGYLMFGQEVESQVTLNLHTGKLGSRVAIYKYTIVMSDCYNQIFFHSNLIEQIWASPIIASRLKLNILYYIYAIIWAYTQVVQSK
jgi:hypothetical protein